MDRGDDMYCDLKVPMKTKREREEEMEKQKKVESSMKITTAVKRHKKKLDVAATMMKLERYMLVDKKFAKASGLFCQLMSDHLTVESSGLFLKTLTTVIAEKSKTLSGRKEFQTLIETLEAKRDVLLSTGGDEQKERERMLDTWKFLAITHAQLFTDETYQFSKAAKVVKARLEDMVSHREGQNDEEQARRLHAELMPLLRTLYSKLGLAWASTIVEGVLALATRHRLLFKDVDRVEVDAWTKGIQERRSAPVIARSAGSDARRNIVTFTGSTTAQAGAKIPGRSNHPLFNKEL